jgi:hypothetical protein
MLKDTDILQLLEGCHLLNLGILYADHLSARKGSLLTLLLFQRPNDGNTSLVEAALDLAFQVAAWIYLMEIAI